MMKEHADAKALPKIKPVLPTWQELKDMLDGAHASYSERAIPAGGMIGWDREPQPFCCFVRAGDVEIFALEADGRMKILDRCGEGDFFGFQILKGDCRPHATARALMDSSLVLIPKDSFYRAVRTGGDFAVLMVEYLYGLLYAQTREVATLSFRSAHQRLAMLLLQLAEELPEGAHRDVRCGNNRIADMLGVSRNSVTSSLSLMQKQGIIEKGRNSIRILDVEKLRRIIPE